jgi:Protein of unknown function (DUF3300)
MIRTLATKVLSTSLCFLLVILTGPFGAEVQLSAQEPAPAYSGQGVPLTPAELQGLAAPIALYPDALVAQILGAATFPDQIATAANWLQQHPGLTGQPLLSAVDAQSWEPSVKALTQFPSVLSNMAKNLSWTSALGEAYATQGADVMAAVQVLRAKAQAAGNLKSSPQITVVQQSPQVIVIQPANPQVIYVPAYNPAVVYGYPYVVPGYSTAAVVTTGVIAFGVGIAVGMAISGGYGWGYSSWNCNWHSTTVIYHGGAYYGNAAWHGGGYGSVSTAYNPYNGAVAKGGTVSNGYGTASGAKGYNPSTGTAARGATASNGYGTVSGGQAYNTRTGASAGTVQGSNAYGSYGASTASKNGTTVNSQHQTNSNGTTAQMQGSNGGSAYGASGKYGNSAAVGQTANGNKYATANGNTYSNTGNGWSGNSNNTQKANPNSAAAKGYGSQPKPTGSSAFGGGSSGWQSKADSSRGAASMGGGGGWNRGGGGGGGYRR